VHQLEKELQAAGDRLHDHEEKNIELSKQLNKAH